MTKERRRRLNSLVDMMNAKLQSVVDSWTNPDNAPNYWPNVHFINYDYRFDGHRLCEEGFTKQSNTESLVGDDGPGRQWVEWLHQAKAENSSLEINPAYAGIDFLNPGDDLSGGYPLPISRVFHPTGPGHKAIMEEITSQIEQAIQAAQDHEYGGKQYGPSKFCQVLNRGAELCMDIPDGCYIEVPEYNYIPEIICD
ncbi:hypothetical protein CC78DRAFT_588203 [Lojkania enalia]|uniref:Uncharacterized protein n=1 Tax=Lojkania enalia TaxID=147567 RepID=A0A9P4JW11_9PLEO|nr:hypothetical protein CC78DRAFT_588203 [Didymosphaeria enalia]